MLLDAGFLRFCEDGVVQLGSPGAVDDLLALLQAFLGPCMPKDGLDDEVEAMHEAPAGDACRD